MITIVNYEMGNLTSVKNAFEYLGYNVKIAQNNLDIQNADKLVLPGVGSYKMAMENIHRLGILKCIQKKVEQKCPILGICLGMQLLAKDSREDGYTNGFGFLPYNVEKFIEKEDISIPHMGFNDVKIVNKNSKMFFGINDLSDFYFVHSYRIEKNKDGYISGITVYGSEFVSAFEKDNIWGVQFHPEKSQSNGLKLLSNFARL